MKKHIFLNALLLCIASVMYAQAPQAICYQAAAKDADGVSITNQGISIKATVHQNGPSGTAQWIERHSPTTDQFGLFSINIGEGVYLGGAQTQFNTIDWGSGTHYLRIEMDVLGGQNFILMGTSQMISVPYALYANNANEANHAATADFATMADVANSVVGDNDLDNTNEIQELVIQNGAIQLQTQDGTLTGNPIQIPNDDASPTNELQELVAQNGALFLENPDGTTNGTGVGFDDSDTNELQDLVIQNGTIFLESPDGTVTGNGFELPIDNDTSSTNELQDLIIQNGTMFLESPDGTITGNGFELPIDNDTSSTNELQELTYDGQNLSISGGNQINLMDGGFNAPGSSSDFPQGIVGDHIVLTTGNYQVPSGKTLWITAGGPIIKLQNIGPPPVLEHPTTPNMPVLGETTVIEDCMCTGILLDTTSVIVPVILDFITDINTYTVPYEKVLFIKSGLKNDQIGRLRVNGEEMEFLRPSFTRGTRIIAFPEDTTVQPVPNIFGNVDVVLTGYLLDKSSLTFDPNGN